MAYAIVHHFPKGTKQQYEASLAAVHPSRDTLPEGQIIHAAGPSADGWTIVAVHESKQSWERFRDTTLMPRMQQGIKGGFATPPQETAIDVYNLQQQGTASAEAEVREASKKFYAALNRMANGNASALGDIWSHDPDVTSMHPINGRQVGWNAVRSSFEQVAQAASGGNVELRDQLIQVVGDVAYELGVEQGRVKLGGEEVSIEHRVTSIYRRTADGWKMVHHHTDVSPKMVDALKRLRAAEVGAHK